jgi:hypothetical protein
MSYRCSTWNGLERAMYRMDVPNGREWDEMPSIVSRGTVAQRRVVLCSERNISSTWNANLSDSPGPAAYITRGMRFSSCKNPGT